MAPEQLEGKEADARTDIFALGALLFEMATGKHAFEGKSRTSLIAAIVSSQPPPISSVTPMRRRRSTTSCASAWRRTPTSAGSAPTTWRRSCAGSPRPGRRRARLRRPSRDGRTASVSPGASRPSALAVAGWLGLSRARPAPAPPRSAHEHPASREAPIEQRRHLARRKAAGLQRHRCERQGAALAAAAGCVRHHSDRRDRRGHAAILVAGRPEPRLLRRQEAEARRRFGRRAHQPAGRGRRRRRLGAERRHSLRTGGGARVPAPSGRRKGRTSRRRSTPRAARRRTAIPSFCRTAATSSTWRSTSPATRGIRPTGSGLARWTRGPPSP